MSEANKAIIMQLFEEALNGGNLDLIDEFFRFEPFEDSASAPSAWPARVGKDALEASKQRLIDIRAAFPDIHWEVHDQIAEGDKVVNRFTISGSHTGAEFMGIPPSGKRIEIKGIGIDRLVDGIVVQGWDVADTHEMLRQLGAGPG